MNHIHKVDQVPVDAITASAPGRLCLAGENLDWMMGGSSVVMAIPLRTTVSVWRNNSTNHFTIQSSEPFGLTQQYDPHDPALKSDGLEHLQAAARLMNDAEASHLAGLHLSASTNLPVGAGVSSSAAVTLAAVAALATLNQTKLTTSEICALAHQIETQTLNIGSGWMDFLSCGYGGVQHITASIKPAHEFLRDQLTGDVEVILVDTIDRRTTKAVLTNRRQDWANRDPKLIQYAQATADIVSNLRSELSHPLPNYQFVGELIGQAHRLLRDTMACSTPLIEACISQAMQAGAYGAKLTGTGHGGCVFILSPVSHSRDIIQRLSSLPVTAQMLSHEAVEGITLQRLGASESLEGLPQTMN